MGLWTGDLSPDERLAQFPAYSLTADLSLLPEGDKAALPHLLKAGKALDELYLSQWWKGNVELRNKLADSANSKILEVFDMYKGPFGIASLRISLTKLGTRTINLSSKMSRTILTAQTSIRKTCPKTISNTTQSYVARTVN